VIYLAKFPWRSGFSPTWRSQPGRPVRTRHQPAESDGESPAKFPRPEPRSPLTSPGGPGARAWCCSPTAAAAVVKARGTGQWPAELQLAGLATVLVGRPANPDEEGLDTHSGQLGFDINLLVGGLSADRLGETGPGHSWSRVACSRQNRRSGPCPRTARPDRSRQSSPAAVDLIFGWHAVLPWEVL